MNIQNCLQINSIPGVPMPVLAFSHGASRRRNIQVKLCRKHTNCKRSEFHELLFAFCKNLALYTMTHIDSVRNVSELIHFLFVNILN